MRNREKVLSAVNAALDELDCRHPDPRYCNWAPCVSPRFIQLACELWDLRDIYGGPSGTLSHATTRDVLARVKAKRAEALGL